MGRSSSNFTIWAVRRCQSAEFYLTRRFYRSELVQWSKIGLMGISVSVRDRLPVAAEVERALRQRIVKGVYRAHTYLPSERQLAKDFSTSRVTVANALGALERDGLVTRTPGRGTRI